MAELKEQAITLCNDLDLPLVSDDDNNYDFILKLSHNHLEVKPTGEPSISKGLWVDFVHGAARHRRLHGGRNMLPKAVGVKKNRRPLVMDATAGLGRDGFLLATSGCEVLMFERHPIVAALLADGLKRAKQHPDTKTIASRITLRTESALGYLTNISEQETRPEVIYLDPMFPPRSKSAKVKKELQILQLLVGEDLDTIRLLDLALTAAVERVVVKRPKNEPPLGDEPPSFSMSGKTTRFDIYLTANRYRRC
ncbi:MAG: class I SAM-dependent methyltransferase [Desulfobulbaceae bacterium]|nr:class I SAM-dependent methyltransferase [Desulfobulbaceae bacterium]